MTEQVPKIRTNDLIDGLHSFHSRIVSDPLCKDLYSKQGWLTFSMASCIAISTSLATFLFISTFIFIT